VCQGVFPNSGFDVKIARSDFDNQTPQFLIFNCSFKATHFKRARRTAPPCPTGIRRGKAKIFPAPRPAKRSANRRKKYDRQAGWLDGRAKK
jgi:hypothetical protein